MTTKPSYFLFTKWTKGESVEKSLRSKPSSEGTSACAPQPPSETEETLGWYGSGDATAGFSTESQTVASGFTRQANKRDAFNEMLGSRDMHTQVGQNPFLAGESYLNHLKIQEDFLRPQNTAMMDAKMNG